MITLELYELKNMMHEMAELGAATYVKRTAPARDGISQREAYKLFGEGRVKRWVSADLVGTMRSGGTERSKILYSRAELMTVEKAEKLNSLINK